jgi:hypothetical protein
MTQWVLDEARGVPFHFLHRDSVRNAYLVYDAACMLDVRCRNTRRCFLSCSVQLFDLGVGMYVIRRVSWGIHAWE